MPKIDFSKVADYFDVPKGKKGRKSKDDYEEIVKAFLEKRENEKNASQDKDAFLKLIYTFRVNRVVRRKDLAGRVGCSLETISHIVRLLKRFNLIGRTESGYVRKRKFYLFLKSFLSEHPEFYSSKEKSCLSTAYENVVRFSR